MENNTVLIVYFITAWRSCSFNDDCNRKCLYQYFSLYALKCSGKTNPATVTCEDYARLLYAGPEGCKDPDAIAFGKIVRKCDKRN